MNFLLSFISDPFSNFHHKSLRRQQRQICEVAASRRSAGQWKMMNSKLWKMDRELLLLGRRDLIMVKSAMHCNKASTHSHTLIVLFWENCRWIGLLHGPRTHHRVLKTNLTSKYTFWKVALSFFKKILDKERHIFNSCNKTFGKLLKSRPFSGVKNPSQFV